MKFLHVTDPHLVARPQKLFGIDVRARLELAVDSINARHADAELCILTGDLAHWAEPKAYDDVKAIMNGLAMPWHPILGNHDDREVFRTAFPDAPDDGNGFLQYTIETTAGRFILLDTLQQGAASGVLCEKRLNWLYAQLSTARSDGVDVALFMHHAPVATGINGLDCMGLRDPENFAAVLTEFGDIRHIFFGHLHRACHGSWHGIPVSTLKSTGYQTELNLDPDAPLTGSTENPAYAIVLISDDAVVVHDHSFLEEGMDFEYHYGKPADSTEPPAHQQDWDL
jgi:3',5'-cyclic AMP phosphodiesterase CpdA